jgi:serine/threonine-protein kinase
MVYVPGGDFMMGRDKSDGGDEYERPAHKVTVRPFFIDAHEVTCAEFREYAKEHTLTGNEVVQCSHRDGQSPVTGVTWDDADSYAKWAGKRLPTEEEWEFAARGTDGRRYPWGNDWRSGLANANGASTGLAKVGSYTGASPFGALDMVGNAWEWTSSNLAAYPGGRLPEQPAEEMRIIRGGSYAEGGGEATTTYRGFLKTRGDKYDKTGFRCVKDVNDRR